MTTRINMLQDQMGRLVNTPGQPQRIISLVPSQTELLFDLGLNDEIVGVTKFCVHPADKVKQKQSIGGTKKFRFDVITDLQPDLIIGNKEENYQEGIHKLEASYPVWMSDIRTLTEALEMIRAVGALVDKKKTAVQLAAEIEAGFAQLQPAARPLRVAYFIWQKPYMVAGHTTFIHDMLTRCGCVNPFADHDGRYPEVTDAMIRDADLDYLLLSSEPFPFKEKHQAAFVEQFPESPAVLVDGELFSWYGSRLLKAVPYLNALVAQLNEI